MNGGLSIQSCSQCREPSILFQEYSGQHLCGKHLALSIRKRVAKEIRLQIDLPKDARHADGTPFKIFVAISGGKDSAVLLSMLVDIIGQRRDVDGKICVYRDYDRNSTLNFDIESKSPCFAQPGDKIEFVEISIKQYELMKKDRLRKPNFR